VYILYTIDIKTKYITVFKQCNINTKEIVFLWNETEAEARVTVNNGTT